MLNKIDMHIHTREGSIDARADIESEVKKLKELGFTGMLITDHNSLKGYRKASGMDFGDFHIYCGVEYDTRDCGHMLVILPEKEAASKLFEIRGMYLAMLIKLVHMKGGAVGAAHPYGYRKLGICNTLSYKTGIWKYWIKRLDFIETFNSCCTAEENAMAESLAEELGLLKTGGSDSHVIGCVGKGYTMIAGDEIKDTDSLIGVIRGGEATQAKGEQHRSSRIKHKRIYETSMLLFYAYSYTVASLRKHTLYKKIKREINTGCA